MSLFSKIKSIFVGETFGDTTVNSLTSKSFVKSSSIETGWIGATDLTATSIQSTSINSNTFTIANNEYYIYLGDNPSDPDPAEQFSMNGNACVGNLEVSGSSGLITHGETPGTIYCSGTIECDIAFNMPRHLGNVSRDQTIPNPQSGALIAVAEGTIDNNTITAIQVYDGKQWRTLDWK
jgi:hypothetical protein